MKLTLIIAVLMLAACGSKSTIDLQKQPEAPVTQTPPSGKPGSPANPDDPSQNPEKPEQPDPSVPVPPRYRLVCELGRGGQRATVSSTETGTRSIDPILDLYIGSLRDPNQDVTRANYNLINAQNVVALASPQADQIDLLFTAVSKDKTYERHLYVATVDAVQRLGKATDLGAETRTTPETRKAADVAGLSTANYGASSEGRFLILPSSGGFKITTRDRSRVVGTLSADTSKTILPQILEAQGVFTALVNNGQGFSPIVRKLSISATSVSFARAYDVGNVNASAASIQALDAKRIVWAEEKISGDSSITLAILDTTSGRVSRSSYRTRVAGARIFPQVAVLRDATSTTVNLAVESVVKDPSTTGVQVAYAKLQPLLLNGSSWSEGQVYDYPFASLSKVENFGLSGPFIVNSLVSNSVADRLVGTFDSQNGYQAYTIRGGALDGIGSSECLHPQMTEAQ